MKDEKRNEITTSHLRISPKAGTEYYFADPTDNELTAERQCYPVKPNF